MTEEKVHPLLEQIIKQETEGKRKYSSWASGGLLSVKSVDIDKKGNSLAFILEKNYGIPSAGIEYSIDIGIIRGNKVYRRGFWIARGGGRDHKDDFHGWYKKVKIIEETPSNIVLKLESGKAIDTCQLDLKGGYFERTARRDLEAEEREKERQELEEKLKASENFDEFLENLEKKIKNEHEKKGVYAHTGTTKLTNGMAVIKAGLNPHPYDPVETQVEFYVIRKGQEPVKFVESTGASRWDRPRFSETGASIKYGKCREERDEIIIPVDMEIRQSIGMPERERRILGKKSFELKIKK